MIQKRFALVGISGVGKTTFLKGLSELIDFQHLSAGSLIAEARQKSNEERDFLRSSNIDENQQLLVSGFMLKVDPSAERVILDGHIIIHTEVGIELIDPSVFEEMAIGGIIHLSAPPEQVESNRIRDTKRQRPNLGVKELSDHQGLSLSTTRKVCEYLRIPFLEVSTKDVRLARQFIFDLGQHSLLESSRFDAQRDH